MQNCPALKQICVFHFSVDCKSKLSGKYAVQRNKIPFDPQRCQFLTLSRPSEDRVMSRMPTSLVSLDGFDSVIRVVFSLTCVSCMELSDIGTTFYIRVISFLFTEILIQLRST